MATSIREWLPRKETPTSTRKGLRGKESPAQHRASPNVLSPSRPIGTKSAASTTEKSISNHVMRMRGRLNVDQPLMKHATTKNPVALSNKPWFPRSYDHNSPNTSQSIKACQSPNLKERGMRTSSSFSGPRSSGKTLQKATSSRTGKTAAKDVEKRQSSSARPVILKKSNNVKNKKNSRNFAASSRTSVSVPHPQEDDPQPFVTDEEVTSNAVSSHATNEQVPGNTLHKHEIPVDVVKKKERRETDAHDELGVESPETVSVSHPQEGGPQPTVTDEEVLINGLNSNVNDEQFPIDALRNHGIPADVANEKEQRQNEAHMQAEPYIHEKKDIKINKTAPIQEEPYVHEKKDIKINKTSPIQAEPYVHEKNDIKIIKTPTSDEVDNKHPTNSSINTEESKHQKVRSKESHNFHLESQLLQKQLQVNSTNSINKKIVVQAEDQGKEEVKDASKGSMKVKEAEHHNVPSKETDNLHHESQLLPEQFEVNCNDLINKNIEVQARGQGKKEVRDVSKDSMKAEEAEQHNAPSKETSRFHLESRQLQEQPETKNTDPLNENLEVQAKDQGKVEAKDATEPMKQKEELKEEYRVVNFRETEEMKNIASPEPKQQSRPEPAPSPACAPDNTHSKARKHANSVQGKNEENQVVNSRETGEVKNIAFPEPEPQAKSGPRPAPSPPRALEDTLMVVANRPNLVEGKSEENKVVNLRETVVNLRDTDVNNIASLESKSQSKPSLGPTPSTARAPEDALMVKNIASPETKPQSKSSVGPAPSTSSALEDALAVTGKRTNPVPEIKEENQVLNFRETMVKKNVSSEPKSLSKSRVGPAPSPARAPKDILTVAGKQANPVHEKKEENQVVNSRNTEEVKNITSPEQKPQSEPDPRSTPSPIPAPKNIHKVAGKRNPVQQEKKVENQVVNSRETEEVKNIASQKQKPQSKPDPRPAPSPIRAPENTLTITGKHANPVHKKREENQVVNSGQSEEVKNNASLEQKTQPKPDPRPTPSPARAPDNTLMIAGKHAKPVHEKKEENQVVNSRQPEEVKNNASLEQKTQPKPDPRPTSPARAPENTLTIAGKQANPVHEKKEENQVVNSRQHEEMKNNASPEHKPQSKPDAGPTPSSAPAPENTLMITEKRANPVQGKKKLTSLSNDVIEETANKLQAQRKNKVAALAAAFETVISRQ